MIIDIILIGAGVICYIFGFLLQAITAGIPGSFIQALTEYFGYLRYMQGYIPLFPNPTATGLWHSTGLLTILGVMLFMMLNFYTFKLVVWFLRLLPFMNIKPQLNRSNTHKK